MFKSGISILEPPPHAALANNDLGNGADPCELAARISVREPGAWLQIRKAHRFEWTDAELPIPGLPPDLEGLRILHLTDSHLRTSWDPAYDQLIQRVQADPPDLILYTGDFVEHKHDHRPALPQVRRLVDGLRSRLGFVTVLGNHDGDLMGPELSAMGVTVLDQQRLRLTAGSATLELIGLVGIDRYDLNRRWLRSIGPKAPNTARIVLSHFPDLIRITEFLKPDLFLAGHTHGGQICLPGRIPILRHDSLPRRLWLGIHRVHGTWLVVNRGTGFSTAMQMRMFCPAEVIEIRLRGV